MTQEARIAHPRVLGSLAIAATAAALLLPQLARAQTTSGDEHSAPMVADLSGRSQDIPWTRGFDPTAADLFSHDELRIDARCERVWTHLVDAKAWPTWYPGVQKVKLMNTYATALKDGTVLLRETSGQVLKSRVDEFVPFSRIGWSDATPGVPPTFHRAFHLTPDRDGCDVVTEEAGKGPAAASKRRADEDAMQRGHDLWLASLKRIFER